VALKRRVTFGVGGGEGKCINALFGKPKK
jgi:hypothetical protein